MRNVLVFLILSLFSLFVIPENVFADSCDYKQKAQLNKYAFNVKAEYEFKKNEDGSTYFDIIVYNIVSDIYVNYKSELEGNSSIGTNINYEATNSGTYRFSIPIPSKSFDYIFYVRTTKEGCAGDLRKFSLSIPIRNSYHDLDVCKKSGMEDYYYCKEWIIDEFNISSSEIEKKINEKYESLKKNTTSQCIGCAEKARNDAKIKAFEELKIKIIIGLAVGIVIDLLVMIIQIVNIRRSEI